MNAGSRVRLALVLAALGGALACGGGEGDVVGPVAEPAAPSATAMAERVTRPVLEEAVGTVTSRLRVVVAAQTSGRILAVAPRAGEAVDRGAPLVTIEGSEQEARFTAARAHFERVRRFLAKRAATPAELEVAEADYLQAKAAVEHTRVVSPMAGVVAERQVEPGDLAWPGRPLLVLLDPRALRLEALVREGLIDAVRPGAAVELALPAAGGRLRGTVTEVLPAADPQSRTFTVRVDFEAGPTVRPGMFGRLRLPVGERTLVRVPAAAVRRVGQLETVLVRDGERWTRRLVSTGPRFEDGTIEILAGLAGGETIGVAAPASRERP